MSGWRKKRAVVAALLVLNQFVVASGLPLPVSAATAKKDFSKPFPCMDRPCGCLNADQCWHSCCCFSMREKLVWAKAHGVEPPEFVREAAAEEERADAANAALHAALRGKKQCCCCCCKHSDPQDGGNSSASSAPAPLEKQPDEPLAPPTGKSVILLMALQCHGQSLVSILAQALPAIVPVVRPYAFLPIADICIFERSTDSIRFSPAVPPPRKLARNFLGSIG